LGCSREGRKEGRKEGRDVRRKEGRRRGKEGWDEGVHAGVQTGTKEGWEERGEERNVLRKEASCHETPPRTATRTPFNQSESQRVILNMLCIWCSKKMFCLDYNTTTRPLSKRTILNII
jgi:hypothetical protein